MPEIWCLAVRICKLFEHVKCQIKMLLIGLYNALVCANSHKQLTLLDYSYCICLSKIQKSWLKTKYAVLGMKVALNLTFCSLYEPWKLDCLLRQHYTSLAAAFDQSE